MVNLDRYHAILGMLFLKQNKVVLNYAGFGSFKLKGRWFPVMDEEVAVLPSGEKKRTGGQAGMAKPKERSKEKVHGACKAEEAMRTNEAVSMPAS